MDTARGLKVVVVGATGNLGTGIVEALGREPDVARSPASRDDRRNGRPPSDLHGRRHHHRRLPPHRAGRGRGDPPALAVPTHAPPGGDLGEQCARRDLCLRGGCRGEGSRADLLVVRRGLFARTLDGSRHRGLAHNMGGRVPPIPARSRTWNVFSTPSNCGRRRCASYGCGPTSSSSANRRPHSDACSSAPCSRETCCAADCSP